MLNVLRKYPKSAAVFGGIGLGSVGLLGYSRTDEGMARSLEFWKNVLPIYFQYRFVQFLNEDISVIDDDSAGVRYTDLHNRYTDDIKVITYKLRGTRS
jgi:hypothetical protein